MPAHSIETRGPCFCSRRRYPLNSRLARMRRSNRTWERRRAQVLRVGTTLWTPTTTVSNTGSSPQRRHQNREAVRQHRASRPRLLSRRLRDRSEIGGDEINSVRRGVDCQGAGAFLRRLRCDHAVMICVILMNYRQSTVAVRTEDEPQAGVECGRVWMFADGKACYVSA